MRENEAYLGLRVGAHVARRRTELTPQALSFVVLATTAVVPCEKFLVPVELDGSRGRYRATKDLCLLAADNDHAAIGVWLSSKAGASHDGEALSSTQRSYRKAAERLLLWDAQVFYIERLSLPHMRHMMLFMKHCLQDRRLT